MSLVFDKFPTMESAEAFVAAAKDKFGLGGQTFDSDKASFEADPGPFDREPFVAHIDRSDLGVGRLSEALDAEERVRRLANQFGGRFIGT